MEAAAGGVGVGGGEGREEVTPRNLPEPDPREGGDGGDDGGEVMMMMMMMMFMVIL